MVNEPVTGSDLESNEIEMNELLSATIGNEQLQEEDNRAVMQDDEASINTMVTSIIDEIIQRIDKPRVSFINYDQR